MTLHWDAIIQGAVTGLVGAAVLALLSLVQSRTRGLLQRRQIRSRLDRMNLGSGIDGINTSIYNETEREMIIRQVAFLIGGAYVVLLPSRELSSSFKGQTRKPTRAEIRRLRKGEMIQMEAQMQFRSWKVDPSPAGFVPLPPYTKTSFILPAQFVAQSNDQIDAIRVVLEYETKSAARRILQHDIKPRDPKHFQQTLNRLREEIATGSFNRARRMFGMPEITTRSKREDGAPTSEQ